MSDDADAPALRVSPMTNRVYVVTKWKEPGVAAEKLDVTEDFDRLIRNSERDLIAERDQLRAFVESIADAYEGQPLGLEARRALGAEQETN